MTATTTPCWDAAHDPLRDREDPTPWDILIDYEDKPVDYDSRLFKYAVKDAADGCLNCPARARIGCLGIEFKTEPWALAIKTELKNRAGAAA